jgi:hypothetical protein
VFWTVDQIKVDVLFINVLKLDLLVINVLNVDVLFINQIKVNGLDISFLVIVLVGNFESPQLLNWYFQCQC